ncbi:glycoside hydrolase family 3 N-terminal domain-containing protein [Lutibacter citreus]|uniref:glycoside hydrolase family 3 N-terminal domain-containing protein n=1 Tax=Lutibacter citreus TaxID=2138210 RepID=UPI000DBE0070|nr:glycoside hydrolase family 3 N-terminal domain-containing protein [Lutibacter citreus]
MKNFQKSLTLILFISLFACKNSTELVNNSKKDVAIYTKIDSILSQMTFQQKIGQLQQRVIKKIDDSLKNEIRNGDVGSILVNLKLITDASVRNKLQKIAIEESELGIPIIFGQDVIHGYKTMFPISLAQSCSWDTLKVKKAASIAAKEATTLGIDWTFAPMIDVSRDPRWGRIAECYGEDTFLNTQFGIAAVKGFQGEDVSQPDKLVSCLKHYVGYGASMGGRDYQYTEISKRSLHETYLPPFEACVNTGVLTVMSSFNDISGVPASANKETLRNILKDKWQFPGFVISDWDAVEQLIYHGYATDSIDAAYKALNAGIDIEMKSNTFKKMLEEKIAINVLNDAVKRVLYVKLKKGLFKTPYVDENRSKTDLLTKEHRLLARKLASETMVLLENKNSILPIKNKPLKISVVGPFSKEKNLSGWWRSNGNKDDLVVPFEGLLKNAPNNIKIIDKVNSSTDIIIACVGEEYSMFGENNSRSSIELPNKQSEYISSLKKYNKPIITVVFNGRPLNLTSEKENSNALLIAWHPGTEAGNALADVLFGNVNPSAKLTTSFPAATGHIPVYYNHRNSGRPKYNSYKKESTAPLYPFGFGLSYSTFKYDNIKISSKDILENDSITISAEITNISNIEGTEIAQLYVQDLVGSTTRPIKELKGFKKLKLKENETKTVNFTISTSDLTVLNENMKPIVEKGRFKVWIGPNSNNGLEETFNIK